MLFYHLKLRRYVVIELEAVKFEPAFLGQLGRYMAAVDDLLAHPDDEATIGLLLCKSKNDVVADMPCVVRRHPSASPNGPRRSPPRCQRTSPRPCRASPTWKRNCPSWTPSRMRPNRINREHPQALGRADGRAARL